VIENTRARELVERWRAEAKDLRSLYFDERLANVVSRYADELAEALEQEQGESLTLTAAARESGYSAEHLGRLLRDGKLRNVGRLHAPRVLRRDLPLKSGLRTDKLSLNIAADRTEIARSIVTQTV
jgi:hypothetical protein